MTDWPLFIVVMAAALAAQLFGYFVIGELFLGWLCRRGTLHIRPRHPRQSTTRQRPIGAALRRVTLTDGQGWCAPDSDTPPMPRPLAHWLARRWNGNGTVYRVINVYNWQETE